MAARSAERVEQPSEAAFLAALLASQRRAVWAVVERSEAIVAAAATLADQLQVDGRLVYIGAGSSGLIAVQDGAELPGTFGLDADRIIFVVPGGVAKAAELDATAEDDVVAAARDVAALGAMRRDVVIAVSASGSTPYTLAGAQAARERGATIIALAGRPGSPLLQIADHPILLDTGPEALHGSTRLAAGTAQKCALGLLSTLASARLGHVYRGHMVNLRAGNEKLRRRAAHIVASIAGVDEEAANESLARAQGDVKSAILVAGGAESARRAQDLLAASGGHVGAALASLRGAAHC